MSKPWDKLRVPPPRPRPHPISEGQWEFNGSGAVLITQMSRNCADIAVGEGANLSDREAWTVHKHHAKQLAEFFKELADQLESQ